MSELAIPAPESPVLDAHLHLWDPHRMRYPWLDGTALDRPFLPADLPQFPDAAVVVQADAEPRFAEAEVRWLSALAEAWPGIRGVVAYAPLERGADVTGDLRVLAGYPLVRGVRRLLQDTDGLLGSAGLTAGVRVLAWHGWPFDACVRMHQLGGVAQLARECPDVVVVLDHAGKPAVGSDPTTWHSDLRAVAAAPNTVCKLSGLTSEAPPGSPVATALPYLRAALEAFGPERCLFGSDWPVASASVGYAEWLTTVLRAVDDHAGAHGTDVAAARRAVLWETAARVYGVV